MSLLTDLISYWKLDEASGDALDAHGSNTVTDLNNPGSASGIINTSRTFSRASNQAFVTSGNNASLQTGNIDFSLSCWFKLSTLPSLEGTSYAIVSKIDASAAIYEYILYVENAGGGVYNLIILGFDEESPTFLVAKEIVGLTTDVWYHAAYTHNAATGESLLVINASEFGFGIDANTPVATTGGEFSIGSANPSSLGAELTFDGSIDEVGFWKRVLTFNEILELYNSGNGLSYDDFGGGAETEGAFQADAFQNDAFQVEEGGNFVYTASGGLSLGNSVNVQTTYLYTASGGLSLGNSANLRLTYLYTASGGLSLGNSVNVQTTYLYTAIGGLSLGNSVNVQTTYLYTTIGGLSSGNSATVQLIYFYDATSGSLSLGNTSQAAQTVFYTASGNLSLGDNSFTQPTYLFAASGGLSLAGEAGVQFQRYFTYTATGGLANENSATVTLAVQFTATGGLSASGSAFANFILFYNGSGGLNLGNSAESGIVYPYAATGSLSLSSSVGLFTHYLYEGLGGLNTGNTVNVTVRYQYNASGSLEIEGSSLASSILSSYSYTAEGTLSTGSSGEVTFTLGYVASGSLAVQDEEDKGTLIFSYIGGGTLTIVGNFTVQFTPNPEPEPRFPYTIRLRTNEPITNRTDEEKIRSDARKAADFARSRTVITPTPGNVPIRRAVPSRGGTRRVPNIPPPPTNNPTPGEVDLR